MVVPSSLVISTSDELGLGAGLFCGRRPQGGRCKYEPRADCRRPPDGKNQLRLLFYSAHVRQFPPHACASANSRPVGRSPPGTATSPRDPSVFLIVPRFAGSAGSLAAPRNLVCGPSPVKPIPRGHFAPPMCAFSSRPTRFGAEPERRTISRTASDFAPPRSAPVCRFGRRRTGRAFPHRRGRCVIQLDFAAASDSAALRAGQAPLHRLRIAPRRRARGSLAGDRAATAATPRAPWPLRVVAVQAVPHQPRHEPAERQVRVLVRPERIVVDYDNRLRRKFSKRIQCSPSDGPL